ncbi:ankyrin repeat domain-containing protein [Legionella oakridgensis]|uniref:Uncharacterized protein n=2 Tax=Legionella oakridgensis TaxID=29423 RepID=W0BIF6_9GAMM|nr:ankyrin repeat domain-containing protein [Legionella oakridgensis]AHE68397.1 hypothetical protein Loa_02869 [Legionella oakridgensis ATCC 33761 = DSM 21215]ETO92143.1 ankyrin repeats protein [Legionella oakridgensis RV-2-2007]KTD38446.1 Ankyrin repeats (3 copies) [Legionella oakridgensis]STY21336.1 Ankyrin repeats (3 copies) [Legionella longbeachae]
MKFTEGQMVQISNALETHISANRSGAEVVLTVGESLLMLIRACKKASVDAEIISKLKVLYLEGIKSEDDKAFITNIKELLADEKQFRVSADPKLVNADPSRRYFETHLAYHMLAPTAEALETEQLQAFTGKLKDNLSRVLANKPKEKAAVELILDGNMHPSLNKYQLEYAEVIYKLKTHDFHGLSPKACDNLCEIAKSTILATLNTQHDHSMPADIYEDSVFTMGMDGRGRKIKREHEHVLTAAKGLIRSTIPLPFTDIAVDGGMKEYEVPLYQDEVDADGQVKRVPVTKIVRDAEGIEKEVPVTVTHTRMVVSPFQRSADQADFMIESQWSQHLFARQTHIYSNGISSTTLAMLRNILMQKREGHPFHGDYFEDYMKAFTALMIYNSGGHSLFEIFEVFKLPQLREIMDATDCSGLLERDELMQQWLFEDQPESFDKAMDETIDYLHTLVNRRILNAQLQSWMSHVGTLKSITTGDVRDVRAGLAIEIEDSSLDLEALTLHRAVLTLDADEFAIAIGATLLAHPELDLNAKNTSGYTAMMVAAQVGKLEHVKILVEYGAKVTNSLKQKNGERGLTALELAIKSEKYPVVEYLLGLKRPDNAKRPALPVKMSNSGSLKERAPALYFACRQGDMRILEAVIKSDPALTLMDKALAILETVQFENLEGAKTLIDLLTPAEFSKLQEETKQQILDKAAERGNVALIDQLLFCMAPKVIDYNSMLQNACKNNYVPMVRSLLSYARDNEVVLMEQVFNHLMIAALANGYYDMAVLAIAYGANPEEISSSGEYLKGFTQYLRTTPPEHFNAFFSDRDREMIEQRAQDIQKAHVNRTSGIWNAFISLLVEFLSKLPFVNLGGYYQKTEVIARIAYQVVTNEAPKKDYEIGYGSAPVGLERESEHLVRSGENYNGNDAARMSASEFGPGRVSRLSMFGLIRKPKLFSYEFEERGENSPGITPEVEEGYEEAPRVTP